MKRKTISLLTVITILICMFSINVGAERKVLSFSRESISLFEDQSFQLDLNSDSGELRYSSTDPDIATVNSTGKVTAVSFGTSVITATDIDGNQAHCSVNVLIGESPDRVTVNTQSLSLRTGESFTLEAKVYPEDIEDTRVKFFSSDEKIATVDKNGYITAKDPGVAVITAESASAAVSEKCIVKVSSRSGGNTGVNISGVLYSVAGEKKVNMRVGINNEKETLETTTDKNGKFYFDDILQGTYTLSVYKNSSSKSPSATGQLYVGTYNMSISCIINNKDIVILSQDENTGAEKVRDITLAKTVLSLELGAAYDMTFKVTPQGAALPVMVGKSSDTDVATVDVDGRITAVSEGTAKITFQTKDGRISRTCKITVVRENSNTYSWLIILIEALVLASIVIVFTIFYKKFSLKKEKAEGLWDDDDVKRRK